MHSYKGKFIPQLVEYFLDQHIDDFKTESFFNKGNIVLDPFCGSGTIPIEAALIGRNLAPGLHRTFTAEAWPQIPARAPQEARRLVAAGRSRGR